MKTETENGIAYLKPLVRYSANPQFAQMVQDRDSVAREYGHLFHPDQLGRLTAEDFKGFLLYENNRHWWGIHRHQAKLVSDMDRLRGAFDVLLDESRPITSRLDWIEPSQGLKPVPGLGKAVFTPILHVVYPDVYGVWNSIAESAMQRLGFWPEFARGPGFGTKYVEVNDRIKGIAGEVGVDLWTVDSLWWVTELEHEPTKHQFEGGTSRTGGSTQSSRRSSARNTFLCNSCFLTKAGNLMSTDPELCIDCNPATPDETVRGKPTKE